MGIARRRERQHNHTQTKPALTRQVAASARPLPAPPLCSVQPPHAARLPMHRLAGVEAGWATAVRSRHPSVGQRWRWPKLPTRAVEASGRCEAQGHARQPARPHPTPARCLGTHQHRCPRPRHRRQPGAAMRRCPTRAPARTTAPHVAASTATGGAAPSSSRRRGRPAT
eukprot:scaffold5161_cov125-Isochrysis_galbana.AAC.7